MAEPMSSSTNAAGDALLAVYALVRRRVDSALLPHSSSVSRLKLLLILESEGPTRTGNLSAALDLAVRSVMDALGSLERDGLISRHRDPDDRRAVVASITTEGRTSLRRALRARKRAMDEIFGGLRDEERVVFVQILGKLRERMTMAAR